MIEVFADDVFELGNGSMRSSPELSLGERCEEAYDLIEPRAVRRGEVQCGARMAQQPSFDLCGLMCAVVVEDQMDVEIFVRRDVADAFSGAGGRNAAGHGVASSWMGSQYRT